MNKQKSGLKEMIRKAIVSLKRKPQTIPLMVLGAAFLLYSLNLTQVSNTTAKIQLGGMGLSGFATMLFSLLSFVCFLNAFPHRKKVNVPMLVLMFLMLGILIFCDTFYIQKIIQAITRPDHPILVDVNTLYIDRAQRMLALHRIIVAAGAVLTMMVPLLRKWLNRIDTSLPVEDGAQMHDLHLSEDA